MANSGRSKNFTDIEKLHLINIIKDKGLLDIIQSKKNDHVSLNKKETAWNSILMDFSAVSSLSRTIKQLQVLWRDLKSRAKEKYTAMKKERLSTGGGRSEMEIDQVNKAMIDILPQALLEPLSGINDSDVSMHETSQNFNSSFEIEEDVPVMDPPKKKPCKEALQIDPKPVSSNGDDDLSEDNTGIKENLPEMKALRQETMKLGKTVTPVITENDVLAEKLKLIKDIRRQQEMQHDVKMEILNNIRQKTSQQNGLEEEIQRNAFSYVDFLNM